MAFSTATKKSNLKAIGLQPVMSGAAQADWEQANSSLQTVNTDVLLNLAHATSYSNVIPLEVPTGVTRMWLRGQVDDAATTFTTDPILKLVGADANGIPQRLDSDDCDAAGVTIDFTGTTTMFTDGSSYWTDVYGGASGYDLKGNKTIYILVSTAAAITDGANPVTASAYVKWGN